MLPSFGGEVAKWGFKPMRKLLLVPRVHRIFRGDWPDAKSKQSPPQFDTKNLVIHFR